MEEQALEEVRQLLREIRSLLAMGLREQIRASLGQLLSTDRRRSMYELFDGKKTLEEVAARVKVSSEAVRLFAREMEEAGAVRMEKKGNKICPLALA